MTPSLHDIVRDIVHSIAMMAVLALVCSPFLWTLWNNILVSKFPIGSIQPISFLDGFSINFLVNILWYLKLQKRDVIIANSAIPEGEDDKERENS